MNAYRRGACPGLSDPMPTGDGLLVRLTPAGALDLAAFAAICEAALEHGNGTIEVTQRGSLQIRGLTPLSAPQFTLAVEALGIAPADRVTTDPLPDDPTALIDTSSLAANLRRAMADAQLVLAPKVSIVLDGGGRLHLDALAADVRLQAIETPDGASFLLALGGDARSAVPLGSIAPDAAVDAIIGLLHAIAARGPTARAVDILTQGMAPLRVAASVGPVSRPSPRPPAEPIGQHPLPDGIALGIALAFGHAHADALLAFARIASGHGVRSVRPAPGRALLLLTGVSSNVTALVSAAEQLDFITRPDDRRRSVAACAGKPACASALIATRTLAAEIASLASIPAGMIHVSGCPKGCAHPAAAALTLVGTEQGCGVIHNGTARTRPEFIVDPSEAVAEVRRLARTPEAAHG